jgi:hypothetical protein
MQGSPRALGLDRLLQPLPGAGRNACRLAVVIWCYLDDSGTDGTTPTVTMTGYLSSASEWNRFERKTKALFKRYKIGHLSIGAGSSPLIGVQSRPLSSMV